MNDPPAALAIDPARVEQLRALGGARFLSEMAGLFVEFTAAKQAELERAIATGDVFRVLRTAHAIKSSAGNIGAQAVVELVREVEAHGSQGRPQDALATAKGIAARLLEARTALAAHGVGSAPPSP